MGSGLMGSYAAAASVDSDNDAGVTLSKNTLEVLEGGGVDNDCCATCGNGGCASGYTYAGQVVIDSGTLSSTYPDFYPHCGTMYCGNTCCVPSSGGSEFSFVANVGSWSNGRAQCQSRGGDLATIHSAAEDAAAKAVVPSGSSAWFGLSDTTTEGSYAWVDGSALDYINWAGGEPNNWGGNEDCGGYYKGHTSGWADGGCDEYAEQVQHFRAMFKRKLLSATSLDLEGWEPAEDDATASTASTAISAMWSLWTLMIFDESVVEAVSTKTLSSTFFSKCTVSAIFSSVSSETWQAASKPSATLTGCKPLSRSFSACSSKAPASTTTPVVPSPISSPTRWPARRSIAAALQLLPAPTRKFATFTATHGCPQAVSV